MSITGMIMLLTGLISAPIPVYAESENEYDHTKVEDDLKDVDLSLYPIDSMGSPAIASFVEYCYTENVWRSGNYALYVYVYNPSQKEFSTRSGANGINIATSYNEAGEPEEYSILPLKLCGATTGKYDKLIYKFRVENIEKIYANATEYQAEYGYRRYDISNLLLSEVGESAEKCVVGREYKYTGYAKGYGEDSSAESTLKCEWEKAEVYDAEVSHTNYRMESEYKDYTRQEVNTVYFSVPDKYITDYGNLQGIRAQWYEYVTSPIFVTEDNEAYEALKEYIGVNIGEKNENLKWRVLWDVETVSDIDTTSYYYHKVYNNAEDPNPFNLYHAAGDLVCTPQISWLFSTGGESYKDYSVSWSQIESWAEGYSEVYGKDTEILGRYSEELFAESIDSDRVQYLENPEEGRGLIIRDFDAEDEFNLLSYDDTHSGWDKFFDYFGNWWNIPDETGKTYSPIEEITSANFTGNKETDCKNLLINEEDYETFSAAYEESKKAGEHLFVFRFAQTDYMSTPARFDLLAPFGSSGASVSNIDGYVAQQTVFLDFTMIHLKFVKEDTETVIPVAQNPIDIWNAVDPPVDDGAFDWLALLKTIGYCVLGILGLIFLVWILSLIFPLIQTVVVGVFKAIWWVISASFKWLADKIKGSGKKK